MEIFLLRFILNLFKYDTMMMGSHPTTLKSEALWNKHNENIQNKKGEKITSTNIQHKILCVLYAGLDGQMTDIICNEIVKKIISSELVTLLKYQGTNVMYR